jgi:hypothetical protein
MARKRQLNLSLSSSSSSTSPETYRSSIFYCYVLTTVWEARSVYSGSVLYTSSETSVLVYKTVCRHVPEYCYLHQRRSDNIRSRTISDNLNVRAHIKLGYCSQQKYFCFNINCKCITSVTKLLPDAWGFSFASVYIILYYNGDLRVTHLSWTSVVSCVAPADCSCRCLTWHSINRQNVGLERPQEEVRAWCGIDPSVCPTVM